MQIKFELWIIKNVKALIYSKSIWKVYEHFQKYLNLWVGTGNEIEYVIEPAFYLLIIKCEVKKLSHNHV